MKTKDCRSMLERHKLDYARLWMTKTPEAVSYTHLKFSQSMTLIPSCLAISKGSLEPQRFTSFSPTRESCSALDVYKRQIYISAVTNRSYGYVERDAERI